MLSFGQKVGLSMAGGAVVGAGIGAGFAEAALSPEVLHNSAIAAHQTVQDDLNAVNHMESQLPADCVRVLRAAATAQAVDPRYDYMQAIRDVQPSVCGVATEEIAKKYWVTQHNLSVDVQNAAHADSMTEPGAALPGAIALIGAITFVGAAFGPMVASGALGNNVPSRQQAWQ